MKLVYTGPLDAVSVEVLDDVTGALYGFIASRLEVIEVDAKVQLHVLTVDPDLDAESPGAPERVVVRLVDALLEQGVWWEPSADEAKAAMKEAGAGAKASPTPTAEEEQ